ncbi:MAG: hypothetical protein IJ077_08640 [Eubacterium sp.]|nr:hypothetical protein [Alphaproteobacteria bacterium]MBQ8981660.1 hypothetical protein [Eubacterium sp.]
MSDIRDLANMTDEEYQEWLAEAVETKNKVDKIDMSKVMLSLMFNHEYKDK